MNQPFEQSQILPHLVQLTQWIQGYAQRLSEHRELLGDENIGYVQNTSVDMLHKLQNMMQSSMTANGVAANPLENRDIRHDMRNLIAVIKGFGDLMRMDVPDNHIIAPSLDQIRAISDQFVALLDQVKATTEHDGIQHAAAS